MEGKKLLLIPVLFIMLLVFGVFAAPQVHAASTGASSHVAPGLTFPDPVCHPADLQLQLTNGSTVCYIGFGFVNPPALAFTVVAGNYNGYAIGHFGTYYFCKGALLTGGPLNGDFVSQVYMSPDPQSWC